MVLHAHIKTVTGTLLHRGLENDDGNSKVLINEHLNKWCHVLKITRRRTCRFYRCCKGRGLQGTG